jgi:tRNA pseudouridine13 synthase
MTEPAWRPFPLLPRAHGPTLAQGRLKERAEDFRVDELLGFSPEGEGEHALLRIRKAGANTEWVARRLAEFARVPVSAVGYAGLKDRQALATQWFSVHTIRDLPDWSTFAAEGVEVLESHRHGRKLRRGALTGNRFVIRIRELRVDSGQLGERWGLLCRSGVPNYVGPQRFGKGEANLHGAFALFRGEAKRASRHLRGLWLSAARSQLFNQVLAVRVERGDWDCPLPGDRMQLAGTGSHFLTEAPDEEIQARTRDFDLGPTGPLWGAGELDTAGAVRALELSVVANFPVLADGLNRAGLGQQRRPLRVRPTETGLELAQSGVLELAFTLPAGAFATAVLRELVDWTEPA